MSKYYRRETKNGLIYTYQKIQENQYIINLIKRQDLNKWKDILNIFKYIVTENTIKIYITKYILQNFITIYKLSLIRSKSQEDF